MRIAAHGSFLEAAKRLHVTQSTVSARVQNLESELGAQLFVRNRSGVTLTAAGRRVHAARQDAGPDRGAGPSRCRSSELLPGDRAAWRSYSAMGRVLPNWVGWMRQAVPDVSIRSEIGFEDDPDAGEPGTRDIGVMYTPSHAPGLIVEHLFDETPEVSTDPNTRRAGR